MCSHQKTTQLIVYPRNMNSGYNYSFHRDTARMQNWTKVVLCVHFDDWASTKYIGLKFSFCYFVNFLLQTAVFIIPVPPVQMLFQREWHIPGDIGGSLGLFIGASVITVFELFDVVVMHLHKKHGVAEGEKRRQGSDNRLPNLVTAQSTRVWYLSRIRK